MPREPKRLPSEYVSFIIYKTTNIPLPRFKRTLVGMAAKCHNNKMTAEMETRAPVRCRNVLESRPAWRPWARQGRPGSTRRRRGRSVPWDTTRRRSSPSVSYHQQTALTRSVRRHSVHVIASIPHSNIQSSTNKTMHVHFLQFQYYTVHWPVTLYMYTAHFVLKPFRGPWSWPPDLDGIILNEKTSLLNSNFLCRLILELPS